MTMTLVTVSLSETNDCDFCTILSFHCPGFT